MNASTRSTDRVDRTACNDESLHIALYLAAHPDALGCRIGRSAWSTAGSSIVEGMGSSLPWAMPRIVLRSILPERVFGSAATTSTSLKHATAPI